MTLPRASIEKDGAVAIDPAGAPLGLLYKARAGIALDNW